MDLTMVAAMVEMWGTRSAAEMAVMMVLMTVALMDEMMVDLWGRY